MAIETVCGRLLAPSPAAQGGLKGCFHGAISKGWDGDQGGAGAGKLQDVFPWETQDCSLERPWHRIPQAGES